MLKFQKLIRASQIALILLVVFSISCTSNNTTTKSNNPGPTTQSQLASGALAAGPVGLCFDGTYIWTANKSTNNVTKMRPTDGGIEGVYNVGQGPNDV